MGAGGNHSVLGTPGIKLLFAALPRDVEPPSVKGMLVGTACAGGGQGEVHGEVNGVLVHTTAAWNFHGGLEPQFENAPQSAPNVSKEIKRWWESKYN